MILRNGKMIGDDNIVIDFDYASRMWKENKISIGNGMYKYK